jgi:uncharacterized protein (DUF1810 family)
VKAAHDLRRFECAQEEHDIYASATAELRAGRKLSHWMWFVFPQIAGLGRSETSRRYAISSLEEARAYISHPVLGPRLLECARILMQSSGRSAEDILGCIDARKLHSSMSLFARAAPEQALFQEVLDRYFGGARDVQTERLLKAAAASAESASGGSQQG